MFNVVKYVDLKMHLNLLHFVFKKSKNLVSSRSRESDLVSRPVSWDKCLVTPLVNTYFWYFDCKIPLPPWGLHFHMQMSHTESLHIFTAIAAEGWTQPSSQIIALLQL